MAMNQAGDDGPVMEARDGCWRDQDVGEAIRHVVEQ